MSSKSVWWHFSKLFGKQVFTSQDPPYFFNFNFNFPKTTSDVIALVALLGNG